MKTLSILAACAVVLVSAGCSSVSVNHDYDPQVNFSQYKTFSWLPIPAKATTNQLVVRRIKDAMTRQLEAKGILLVSQNANFLIAMHGATKEKLEIQDWGYSSRRAAYWGQRDVSVQQYTEGTLIVDFVDAQSKQMFWRGVATGAVDPNATPEKREKRMNEGVAKLLEKFPPVPST